MVITNFVALTQTLTGDTKKQLFEKTKSSLTPLRNRCETSGVKGRVSVLVGQKRDRPWILDQIEESGKGQ